MVTLQNLYLYGDRSLNMTINPVWNVVYASKYKHGDDV